MINSSDILHGKILIVDDKQPTILLLERMLLGVGYIAVSSTLDSGQVCDLHRLNHYDLILLDLQMPGLDGFDVMAALKSIDTEDYLPVLVITAHPGHKQQALQSGAMDFISKPFELAEVLMRVRNMLEMRLMHLESKRQIQTLEIKLQEIERSRDLLKIQSATASIHREILSSKTKTAGTELLPPHVPRALRHHILLTIEDNPADMKLVERILARHPEMRMVSAVNGNSGIQLARELLPDVILVDINLPDISGFKTLEILRADTATTHIPVIAISINAATETIESGLQAGFFRYITKPIKVDELMQALEVALEYADHRDSQIA